MEVNFVISAAMSTSSNVDLAASRFSIVVARLADANSNLDINAPIEARDELISEIAVFRARCPR